MSEPVARVELMPDYGVDVPLWAGMANWEDIELPEHVIERLRAWQADFDDGFRFDRGWLDPVRREAWTRANARLVELLQDQLDPAIDLVVDLWPITHRRS